MAEPLKKNAGIALVWSFIDKGGQQIIQLVVGCILARLLVPDQFGLVAVLSIFTAIANLLQDSGFSSALVRKRNVLDGEYTSVFYFNIAIGLSLYAILFFCAPLIANYYDKPILTNLSRFIFLSFVFNSFGIIQNINLIRKMDFKTNTRITLIAGCISGIIAIIMALYGFGVWSLAAQLVIQNFLRNLFLWIFIKWKPSGRFSFSYIKEMSAFSFKLLSTGLMNQVCTNIYPIIIGKYFSFSQTGLYGQAYKLNTIPQSVISEGLKSVVYPMLTKTTDEEQTIRAFRKTIRVASFISFPVALILTVMAPSIVRILLGNSWDAAIPILQILAVGGSVFPIYSLYATLLQYKGHSGSFFNMELIKNVLYLISIIISIQFGVLGLVIGMSAINVIIFFIGSYFFIGKLTTYSLRNILSDIFPYLVIAIISFAPLYLLNQLISNPILLLIVQLLIGAGLYLLIVKLLGSKVLDDFIGMIRKNNKQ